MRKIFLIVLFTLAVHGLIAQTQTYLTPNVVTSTNEQWNTNHGVRSLGGSGYNDSRPVIRFNETISSGESVSFDVVGPTNFYAIGLASGTSETSVYAYPSSNANMKYGMLVGADNGGHLSVAIAYEAGIVVGSNTPISAGNVLRINYSGSVITYQKSTDGGTNFTTFYTSLVSATGSYYVYFEAPPAGAGPANIYKTGVVTNQPPVVSAGSDLEVALPITETTLVGSATDADGTIASSLWEKVSGPAGGNILSATTTSTQITGLSEGNYIFRFTATDNSGASASDLVQVSVQTADPNGTTVITPSIIPFSDPEIVSHGRGFEDWQLQNYVNIPTEAAQTERKAYYFRWAWFEFERGNNVFDWTAFDREINIAISKNQVFSFSIMAQTTGATWRTGIQPDSALFSGTYYKMYYPQYLHTLMQAEVSTSQDWVSTLGREWVPNYNSPNFIAKAKRLQDSIYHHIQNTSYLGVPYKNVIEYYDIGLIGDYGEWHFARTAPDTTYFPTGRQPTIAALDSIISQGADAMSTFKTVINVSVYDAYHSPNTWMPPAVAYFALTKRNQWGPIGWRREQWGFANNGATYIHNWLDQNVKSFGGIRFDTAIMNRYKYAPIVGEPPGNWDNQDVPYMKNLPAEVKFYHAMSIGNGNYFTNPMFHPELLTAGTRDSVRLASKLSGYRIQIDSASMSTLGIVGGVINIRVYWKNIGVAPPYDSWIVKYLVKNSSGTTSITDTSSFHPALFLPSTEATSFQDQIQIPSTFPAGTYSLYLSIEDSLGYRSNMAIANTGRQANGTYPLRGAFAITTGTSNQSPSVSATGSRFVQLPLTTDTIYANAQDPDGTISSYAWVKISGPSGGTIVSPTASSTRLTGLIAGTYLYEVTVTDNSGSTSTSSISITVQAANVAPVAFAGRDISIYSSGTNTTLYGSGSDADGSISTYAWTQTTGPNTAVIGTPSTGTTVVSGLVVGSYNFVLTVTDNLGATHTDNVVVTVVTASMPRRRVIVKTHQ